MSDSLGAASAAGDDQHAAAVGDPAPPSSMSLSETPSPSTAAVPTAALVPHRVVIVGGGFAGLYAARALGKDDRVAVTLVDRRNHHLFAPLLYQVATGALAPGEIAQPLRSVLRGQANTTVLLGEANGLGADRHELHLADGGTLGYDTLTVASGAHHSYFGHDSWAAIAPRLKTLDDAVWIRRKIIIAVEAAEREHHAQRSQEERTTVS